MGYEFLRETGRKLKMIRSDLGWVRRRWPPRKKKKKWKHNGVARARTGDLQCVRQTDLITNYTTTPSYNTLFINFLYYLYNFSVLTIF